MKKGGGSKHILVRWVISLIKPIGIQSTNRKKESANEFPQEDD